LNEEYLFNAKGAMLNASFLDYRMPTSLDLPMIETVLVEVTNPGHPVWSKNSCGLAVVVLEESAEPFTTPNRAMMRSVLA
jgi:hypothetical protein